MDRLYEPAKLVVLYGLGSIARSSNRYRSRMDAALTRIKQGAPSAPGVLPDGRRIPPCYR
jgi:hypothetical protein